MMKKIGVLFITLYFFNFFLYAESYLSSATCSSTTYHQLKNEINLDDINSTVAPYRAEAFLSNHIYSIDKTRDIGEEFQFGKNRLAKLIFYETDKAGFVAGVYVVNNKRIVIAFAGTTGKEAFSDESALWIDVKTNLALLSDYSTNGQIYSTITFIQRMQVKLANLYPNYSITVTGHSLGGGLAQFASLASKNYGKYKKIKAVTFNTAPMPLTNITKKWIDKLDTQKKWSDANNINFMTNLDPLTLTLRYFENREQMGEALTKRFKLAKGFSIDIVYLVLQNILGITNSDKIKKLIYGKRIVLKTNTGHSMLSLLKKFAPQHSNYGSFRHGFDDVPVGNDGYCNVLKLMKRHVISYPRSERDYKYYPNQNTTNYEVALYIVNSFYYLSYRKALKNALKEKRNLTKFDYFIEKFSNVMDIYPLKDGFMSFRTFTNIMREVYKSKIKSFPTYLTVEVQDRKDILDGILTHIEDSMFGIVRFINIKESDLDKPITRMQMTKWIVDSFKFNYLKLIKREQDIVKNIRLLKLTGKGSTDRVLKSDFIDTSY